MKRISEMSYPELDDIAKLIALAIAVSITFGVMIYCFYKAFTV